MGPEALRWVSRFSLRSPGGGEKAAASAVSERGHTATLAEWRKHPNLGRILNSNGMGSVGSTTATLPRTGDRRENLPMQLAIK